MSTLHTLKDLYVEELRDLHSAENQLLKALPAMEKTAQDGALKAAFNDHWDQTREHVQRLEEILGGLEEKPEGKTCKAMKGLIAEGKEHIKEKADPAVKDAALIAAAQRVEHYEISGYGTARTYARLLGYDEAARLLQQTLDEEAAADSRLTDLARSLNLQALSPAGDR